MKATSQPDLFMTYERWYLRTSLIMVVVSILLFAGTAALLQIPTAVPALIITLAGYYFIAHFVFVGWGIGRIVVFLTKIKKQYAGQVTIRRTLIGMLVSPVSMFIAYLAFFLMALSSCAAD